MTENEPNFILIIESGAIVRNVLALFLASEGRQVMTCADEGEAREILKSFPGGIAVNVAPAVRERIGALVTVGGLRPRAQPLLPDPLAAEVRQLVEAAIRETESAIY